MMSFCFQNKVLAVLRASWIALTLSIFETAFAQTNVTPDQWLASQPLPNFATSNNLPLLSTFSWPFPYALRVQLATNWGYALSFNTYNSLDNGGLQNDLNNTNSVGYQVLSFCSNNPGKFTLQVNLDRDIPKTMVSSGFWVTNTNGWFVDNNSNTWQYITNTAYTPIVSPEAPDSDWAALVSYWTSPLSVLQSQAPISIILNGGEYALGVTGYNERAWQFDPRVVAALATNGLSWNLYISEKKAHQLGFLTAAIQNAIPNRQMYVFYGGNGNEEARFAQPGYGNWEDVWANWGWASGVNPAVVNPTTAYQGIATNAAKFQLINTNTDLPSFQDYYVNSLSWTNIPGVHWNQVSDLLTLQLNAVGFDLRLGYTNSYNWVCGGWSLTSTNALCDIPRYTGFLKCLYTSGMVGGVAGYFSLPTNTVPGSIFGENGFAGSFPSNSPPHWLMQLAALSQVHALFSYFSGYLYNGTLLSGPQPHIMSLDQPAYEFTNTAGAVNDRVLARKMNGTNQWLICAWAADAIDTNVTVTIPTLGSVTLYARDCGSVYTATTASNLTLLDVNGLLPTATLPVALASPTDLHIVPQGTN